MISESLNEAFINFGKSLTNFANAAVKIAIEISETILKALIRSSRDTRVRKYYGIYCRTKNKRIKKKQMKKIKAILGGKE